MRLLVYGDLHLESQGFQPKKAWLDEVDVVVQSGDVNYGVKPLTWLAALNKRVFFVPGNHEYWNPVVRRSDPVVDPYVWGGGGMGSSYRLRPTHPADSLDASLLAGAAPLVDVLLNRVVVENGVRFVGTTLWFDPDGHESLAQGMMVDFKRILSSPGVPWSLKDVRSRHATAVGFLTDVLETPFPGKTVVITHHAPSLRSTEGGGRDAVDHLYATPLGHLVEMADLWVHGHVHKKNDYRIGKCRVVANPRGHPSDACRLSFVKDLVVEI